MRFIKAGREELEATLAQEISLALANGPVLFLLPGGSNIASVVNVMNRLANNDNSRLTLMLADERYGEPGHAGSYETLLKQAGLNLHGAKFVPVLTGEEPDITAEMYDMNARKQIEQAATVIAFLGIGASGLISGIMPNSAATYAMKEWAVAYGAAVDTRLTLTPVVYSRINVAVVGAFGSEKGSILHSLAEQTVSVMEQPCQILKHISKVIVFNDQFDAEV